MAVRAPDGRRGRRRSERSAVKGKRRRAAVVHVGGEPDVFGGDAENGGRDARAPRDRLLRRAKVRIWSAADGPVEDGFLGVEAVFGLVEDGLGVGLEGFFVDFFAAVGGEAVHDEGTGSCEFHDGVVDLVALQDAEALGGFGFFAHGDPNVGVEEVGGGGGGFEVFGANDLAPGAIEECGVGLICLGRGDAEFEAEFCGGPNPGAGDIARAVADEGNDFSGDRSALFLEGEDVGEDLAGMLVVGQGVDGRDAGELGEFLDIGLREGANDRAVDHAAEDARGVFDWFATAELNVVRAQKEGLTAEFADADFEGDACAGGRFREEQRPGLVREGLVLAVAAGRFEDFGIVQNRFDVLAGHGFETEQVFHGVSS